MVSSDELTKQILSRLGVEEGEDDNPENEKSQFDCPSSCSTLDYVSEDVHRLGLSLSTLKGIAEAQGKVIGELDSHYRSLWSEHRQLKEDFRQLKEDVDKISKTIKTHSERLDEINRKSDITDFKATLNIKENTRLEEHVNKLDVQLDEERRQRKESDSSLGWLMLGVFVLILLSHQKPERRAKNDLTRSELAIKMAKEYVLLRG